MDRLHRGEVGWAQSGGMRLTRLVQCRHLEMLNGSQATFEAARVAGRGATHNITIAERDVSARVGTCVQMAQATAREHIQATRSQAPGPFPPGR